MEREMNFIDLCVAFGRAIGRGCKACLRVLTHMLRLTYRYWWIVLTIMGLALVAALYYTRKANTINRANAVAMVNVGTLPQFEQAFAPLRAEKMLPEDVAIKDYLHKMKVTNFKTFHVIDCKHDGTVDFIDFENKIKAKDTLNKIMQDRICIQFCIKDRDLDLLPEVEKALLDYLNANKAMQESYAVYLANLSDAAAFNHRQALKLDSLTTHYYFRTKQGKYNFGELSDGTVVMNDWSGDWYVHLFLDDIYDQQEHMQRIDYRYHLATAPVVLENHFWLDSKPVNGRLKCAVVFLFWGWVFGCALAELFDRRKAILAWLKA